MQRHLLVGVSLFFAIFAIESVLYFVGWTTLLGATWDGLVIAGIGTLAWYCWQRKRRPSADPPGTPIGVYLLAAYNLSLGGALCFCGGAILIIDAARSFQDELSWFLGVAGWCAAGFLVASAGVCLLFKRYRNGSAVIGLQLAAGLWQLVLASWGYVYESAAPSDPSGGLKALGYMIYVCFPIGLAVISFVSLFYLMQPHVRSVLVKRGSDRS